MNELELIKIALFKIGETARRIDALASAAQTPRARQLLGNLVRLLVEQEEELRISVGDVRPGAATDLRDAIAGNPAIKHLPRVVPLTKRRGQGRLSIAAAQ